MKSQGKTLDRVIKTGNKWIYFFEEGNAKMRNLLGGKGANLAEMTSLEFPVPPGFTITTEVCTEYNIGGKQLPLGLAHEIEGSVKKLEEKTGKQFGNPKNPLLVSVRSGAPVSMPGMMDTILNLGLNDITAKGLAQLTNDERFALDCYRRFISMFCGVVLNIPKKTFEERLEKTKEAKGVKEDRELQTPDLRELVAQFKHICQEKTGKPFPEDPTEQLLLAIKAVFDSWDTPRAITFRKEKKISDSMGTAVNVQCMVFGNFGDDSGSGVAFSRNPMTGDNEVHGDFLPNAQGEDVVAGIRTPIHLDILKETNSKVYEEFVKNAKKLESHFKELQDIEFTVERGKVYFLQTRSGIPTSTADAVIKILCDMVREGMLSKEEALIKIEAAKVDELLHPRIDPKAEVNIIAKGMSASTGAASGEIVFDADKAENIAVKEGRKVILVRPETNPDDMHGIVNAEGVLTSRGGKTSHAALVARQWGKPCIVGCESLKIDLEKRYMTVNNLIIREGEIITLNATEGEIILGKAPMIPPKDIEGDFELFLSWADDIRKLGVFANADTPLDAIRARKFGATGIGLCRTEHMFMQEERLPIMQGMIMAKTQEERKIKLAQLLPFQRDDFKGILKAMEGYPVTIRLLDPPLHEFLPKLEELLVEVTTFRIKGNNEKELKDKEEQLKRVEELHEQNPMLGLRMCRLGIMYPEIYEMQVRAIFEAACELTKTGCNVYPEVMIPGVGTTEEMVFTESLVRRVASSVLKEKQAKIPYKVGTMIELPRACVVADKIANNAEFFSFGTNDLTQTVFGYSRDDAERAFIPPYQQQGILKDNPFNTLDIEGVGEFMRLAVIKGRQTTKGLKIGICGEHGGDPASVEFCHDLGLTYVSCSPFRVPVARLAAAHAVIRGNVK